MLTLPTQRDHLRALSGEKAVLRALDLRAAGIAATTIQRAVADGELVRLGRGLYQSPAADLDADFTVAEVSQRIPKGVIAMTSALAFHGLTDQIPRQVWVAIGARDWSPAAGHPPVRIIRFADRFLHQGIVRHTVSGVEVRVYSVAKTLADMFRNSRLIDRSVAVEGLKAALAQRKATPAAIADAAQAGRAWRVMRPYLEALTFNG